MKYFSVASNKKRELTTLFIFSLLTTKIYCEESLESKIKNICLKAESSVKSFFEEKRELPEKFQHFEFKNLTNKNETKSIINFLLIDEEARNNLIQTKKDEKKCFQITIKILAVISVILILDCEIHFFLRLCCKRDIFEPSFTNFYKISPFYWILYFILDKQKLNILYKKFLNNQTSRKSKYFIFSFGIIIFIIIIVIFIMTLLVSNEYENSSQVSINVLCSSIKFLNEIQNGKQLQKDGLRLIGLKDINSFLNILMENKNILTNYFNNYTKTYNEINNELNKWENYLIDVQKNLSDIYVSKYSKIMKQKMY